MAGSGPYTRRFDLSKVNGDEWASAVADAIIAAHPDDATYTTAAGISPSGVVHFGNFRDIVTSHLVRQALIAKGKSARLIFSWDNFDRFRKVPFGVPESFAEHIGKPLSKIPDPWGEYASYAEHFQKPFEDAMRRLGIDIEYRDQTALHESGIYDEEIFHALRERGRIADVLLSYMSDKAKGEKGIDPVAYREEYYPISLYSRFTGKDSTKILSYDGVSTVVYRCLETGQEETVDLAKEHIAKLAWKIDWPMRWKHEQVRFEPGGQDHASPGGSYDVASTVAHDIFDYPAPVFVEYKFVGIQGLGAKMSGSKGNAVSPLELLDIYEPELLKWMYFRKRPDQSFELAFNTEIYRQYDEYDAEHVGSPIPFRQAVGFGQIAAWQEDKLGAILGALNLSYADASVARRLPLAKNWLTKYNPDEMIVLRSEPNTEYAGSMSSEQKALIARLRTELASRTDAGVAELEELVYAVPKQDDLDEASLKKAQRAFFKDVYTLLIGRDTGPRLGTYLWSLDRDTVLRLLAIDV
jgi:lysyl-tRNA synthetase class 1